MKNKIVLILILLIAAFLRLYKLGDIPKGLYRDEPSIGYNSYTILKTGKDEYGVRFPLEFKAYGEYKLPVYIYAEIPFMFLFGVNAFSVRLLSAVSGIAGVYGIYLLGKNLARGSDIISTQYVGTISAFIWAISIWNIQLSRAAFEANLMTTIVIFTGYFLLKFIGSRKIVTALSAIILSILAFYTYNTARMFIPLFIFSCLLIYRKNIPKLKSSLLALLFILACIPGFLFIINGNDNRVRQVFELENKEYQLGAALGVTQKYLTHFSPQFLFFEGDTSTPRHSVQEVGLLYFPEIITVIIGISSIFKYKIRYKKFLGLWILFAPFPAAFATPAPHALRASLLLPPLVFLSALGSYGIIDWIKSKISNKLIRFSSYGLLVFCILYSLGTYIHIYYQHYQFRTSWDWNENLTLLAQYISQEYPEKNNTYIIEGNATDIIYFEFFNASHNLLTDKSKYLFIETGSSITPQEGQIVAISGWKGKPNELKNAKELIMSNNSPGYIVGKWQK